jgi:hypothetical protein
VQCVAGALLVSRRTVTICIRDGQLTAEYGDWEVEQQGCCDCNGSDSDSSGSTSCDGDFDLRSIPSDGHELEREYAIIHKSGRDWNCVYLRWGYYQTEDRARTALETMKSLFPPSWWVESALVEFATERGYVASLLICNCRPN